MPTSESNGGLTRSASVDDNILAAREAHGADSDNYSGIKTSTPTPMVEHTLDDVLEVGTQAARYGCGLMKLDWGFNTDFPSRFNGSQPTAT
jgi:hypothetical protein